MNQFTFKQKIMLDIGCGEYKPKGFIGMDKRKVSGVDIVHDAEDLPYPIPNEACSVITMSHLVEHLKPWLIMDVINECWRIIEPKGVLMIATPYYASFGCAQDPTHIHCWNEATPTYFDPTHPNGFYHIYKPKPWKIKKLYWEVNGNMEIGMEKMLHEKEKENKKR